MKRLFLILFIVSNLSLYVQKLITSSTLFSKDKVIELIKLNLQKLGFVTKKINGKFLTAMNIANDKILPIVKLEDILVLASNLNTKIISKIVQ